MQPLQTEGLAFLLQNPGTMLMLGVFIVLFALLGKSGSRGPATSTPLLMILFIGLVMIVIGLLGFL